MVKLGIFLSTNDPRRAIGFQKAKQFKSKKLSKGYIFHKNSSPTSTSNPIRPTFFIWKWLN
jgi:hypothetical protein